MLCCLLLPLQVPLCIRGAADADAEAAKGWRGQRVESGGGGKSLAAILVAVQHMHRL